MRWERERRMNQLFATICWLNFSWVWVHPGLHLMFTACLWLEMWPSFSGSYFPKRNFPSQQSRGWPGPLNGLCLAAGLAYLQAVCPSVGHGPARLATAVPSSGENFYYIPFLTRWQAEIAEPEPVWCAHSRKYAILARPIGSQARSEYLYEQLDCVIWWDM